MKSILFKYLPEKEQELLFSKYKQQIKYTQGGIRENNLDIENTPEEIEMLRKYLFEHNLNLSEIATDFNLSKRTFYSRVSRIALRYLYKQGSLT